VPFESVSIISPYNPKHPLSFFYREAGSCALRCKHRCFSSLQPADLYSIIPLLENGGGKLNLKLSNNRDFTRVPPALFLVPAKKMINAILGQKLETVQQFSGKGKRLPVTAVKAGPCVVVQVRTEAKDGYQAVQLGWGEKDLSRTTKPLQGHFQGAKLTKAPLFLQEIRVDSPQNLRPGDPVKPETIFKPGDDVKVTGWSKGKGFAGVVKRWGFKGGPRTHGQSDRERAPGSIGLGTTPGRIFKGKKMAGRLGNRRVTVKGLQIVTVDPDKQILEIKGLLPGHPGSFLIITKEDAKN